MSKFAVSSDNDTMAKRVKLRPPSSTKDLKNIQNSKVHKRTFFGVVDLSTLLEIHVYVYQSHDTIWVI